MCPYLSPPASPAGPLRPSLRVAAALPFCLLLGACSPALNWRNVQLAGVQTTLPCKPDQAQRVVQLDGQDLTLTMVGCEADAGLYAVSHIRLAQQAQAQAVIDAWRAQALQALRSTATAELSTVPAVGDRPALTVYLATGSNPRGQAVQARWTWVQRGPDIYHWALYAPTVRADMQEPFFGAMQWH